MSDIDAYGAPQKTIDFIEGDHKCDVKYLHSIFDRMIQAGHVFQIIMCFYRQLARRLIDG